MQESNEGEKKPQVEVNEKVVDNEGEVKQDLK